MPQPSPRWSVVVIARDAAELLTRCLDSIVGQLTGECELIVVDNGSTDSTASLLSSYGERVRVVVERRASRGAARNAGVNAARGERILFTDADCVTPSDWIATVADAEGEVLQGEVRCLNPDSSWARWTAQRRAQFRERAGRVVLDTANLAISRRLLDDVGLFDPALVRAEDLDLSLRLRERGTTVRYLPDWVVQTRYPESLPELVATVFEQASWETRVTARVGRPSAEPELRSLSTPELWMFFPSISWSMLRGRASWREGLTGTVHRLGAVHGLLRRSL